MDDQRGPAMGWDEWADHDATALAARVRGGEVTAGELAAQVAEATHMLDGRLHAVLELFGDVVANPDADRPDRDGLLYGVPIFLKDLGSGLAGRVQESGSGLGRGAVVAATDPLVENFLAAGLVPIGRSTTPEFGMSFDTATNYLGAVKTTRNPWNTAHTPGGSSGGSAAMVAAGVTPLSMATDGGGSIRIPAAFCGLVGLKASRGRVPRPLSHNEYGVRISAEGVVSRSVRDTAAAFESLVRVPNGGSFIAMHAPPRGAYLAAITRDPRRLRIGLSAGLWGRATPVDPEVGARVREVAALLDGLGHDVEELDDAAMCDWPALWWSYIAQWVGSRALLPQMAQARGIADIRAEVTPMTWLHIEAAAAYDKFDIWKMMALNNQVTREFGRVMTRHDVLLTPTLAIRAPLANGPYSLLREDIALDDWIGLLCDACRFTMPANETGLPAISVPAGLDSGGLPIGVQFTGNFAGEETLLQLAAQLERARPAWFGARPPVHVAPNNGNAR
jgi:amidase